MSTATAATPGFTTVAAPIDLPESFEAGLQRSRRLAIATERRRQRLTTAVSTTLVGVGGAGMLAFAALMVTLH
ncbi:hypothetical protein AX769_11260 [Frondihabitans sp. PAMC 28766]|uniref:hypothetical protein n=1 Tax=Frondihabitans sp. PAMC 28766 TaxID=1795630 RepID=UPI00078C6E64|nr:hypothetical protein [Frondihabitans sp. PAMC 28766]AMM20610.1 hypothetical protein AX769_11260 [Frondihabitans sp. PAMC 28766]